MTSSTGSQKIVTLKVANLSDAVSEFRSAWVSGEAATPSIAFASWDLMHKALSPKRLELIKTLCGQQPMNIRELARRIGRDFKGVHTDITALIKAGIVERQENKILFPYDGIHVEFDIDVAA